MTEINNDKFNMKNAQIFSQAIAKKFNLTNEQFNNVDWIPIFEVVNFGELRFNNLADCFFKSNNSSYAGDTLDISSDKWQDIAGLVRDSLSAKIYLQII